jgi:imidazoleglycerol phosphate synthase glutamine amidotransferase subunit HisH
MVSITIIFNMVHHDEFFNHIPEIGSNPETCLEESKTMENVQNNTIIYFLFLYAVHL